MENKEDILISLLLKEIGFNNEEIKAISKRIKKRRDDDIKNNFLSINMVDELYLCEKNW